MDCEQGGIGKGEKVDSGVVEGGACSGGVKKGIEAKSEGMGEEGRRDSLVMGDRKGKARGA